LIATKGKNVDTPEDDVRPAGDIDAGDDEHFTDADLDAELDAEEAAAIEAAPGPGAGRLLLGLLAAIVVAALGVVLWSTIYAVREREYIGVAVLIGLLAGYTLRAVSRRSDILTRVLAGVVTALACVAGTIFGQVAYVSHHFGVAYWPLLKKDLPKTFDVLKHRTGVSWAVFAAAIVIAFLAAAPQKPKKEKAAAQPPGWDVPPAEFPASDAAATDAAPEAAADGGDAGGQSAT
jgi:hypothetical protein